MRDTRSNTSRPGTAACVPRNSHHMTTQPSLAVKPAVCMFSARGKQCCAATPNDASSSSPEVFFQPSSGDVGHPNFRAATSPQGSDAPRRHQETPIPPRISSSQAEQGDSSRTTANYKPGEVVKQPSSRRSVRRRNVKEVVIDVSGEAVPQDSTQRVCHCLIVMIIVMSSCKFAAMECHNRHVV
jgi:hypothetical protein